MAADTLCQEAWLVRQGPFETHFVCFLPADHDGLHRDPEWGICKDPEESD